jgi:hypothetical protein
MSENTQLTLASGYDINNIIFSDVQHESIPKSVPQINYKRIMIRTKNSDGTIGDLILPTEKLFSFGVSENTNQETGKVNGYVMPLCLHTRDGATKEEKEWSETFTNIVEKCKDHLLANKEEIEYFDLERNDLKKLNPLNGRLFWTTVFETFSSFFMPTVGSTMSARKFKKRLLALNSISVKGLRLYKPFFIGASCIEFVPSRCSTFR